MSNCTIYSKHFILMAVRQNKDIFAINKHIDNKNKLTRNFVNTDYFKLYVNLIHSSINI